MPSIYLDLYKAAQDPSSSAGALWGSEEECELDTKSFKGIRLQKMDHDNKEFFWLGSPWMSRKRRKHYQAFCRNGVKISVHDFVYVLAEEDKRLVAYLEDMYEDSRSNKMVVVRWFHKIDEVGLVLPHNFNDREIFFSLCLQDLSIECIDGLATVLSPQHFEKFLNEARHTHLQPFMCRKQFDNDDIQPFDITQVRGYWKQEILRYMSVSSSSSDHTNSQRLYEGQRFEKISNDTSEIRPKKRHRQSKDDHVYMQYINRKDSLNAEYTGGHILSKSSDCKSVPELGHIVRIGSAANESGQYLKVGSHVEVLSQDSGMRGCWLRALVIKKHKDKVKVQYHDIKDAADESNLLEEWVLASRVAVSDQFGLRVSGRTIVRPAVDTNKGRVSWAIDIGNIVDVWWHDGWWEGIVIQIEAKDKFHVYFPGEKRKSIFGIGDLRHSQEWLGNRWIHVKERPDAVNSILSGLGMKQVLEKTCDGNAVQPAICASRQSSKDDTESSESLLDSGDEKLKNLDLVPDLSKDGLLSQLKWKSSGKRRRTGGSTIRKQHYRVHCGKNTSEVIGSGTCERFFIPKTIKVDRDNCKYLSDSLFSPSVGPPLTSLVMSR
ncbi:uncharacterized protein LOC123213998 isoform X3 [Mangifera indica]|uniref:uncharacterized protein LOC123213998 isoform X3 n=1 Tax=Mangifera indica TaxID=29780 RepID=UPI001CF94256|nr:uncharacterized protein LOC123213998 isoform X3 [Mangifera indica]